MKKLWRRGSIMLLVLVFGGIFFTLLMALSGFVLTQNHAQNVASERAKATGLAEAGLEYYRWFLSHFPKNTTNGTGQSGPYVISYADPEGGIAGSFTLSIVGNSVCNDVQSIDVTSKGVPSSAPSVSSTLIARYAAPSVAAYSYIIGSSVWAGADRIINGPYHSNGGIRMDGTANAPVSSSLSTWNCTSSFGCSSDTTEPGVFGVGNNQNLWAYPTPQLDFAGIAANFSARKTTAQASGIYLPRYSASSGANSHRGYHLIFNSNGTVTVKTVTSITALTNVYNSSSSSYVTDYTLIGSESAYQTYTLPATCGLIFVEDNTWIEGTIPSKVTVIAAGVIDTAFKPDIVLHGSITYGATDGTAGLTVIGAHDILIAPDSPQNMTLNGIFVAQSGAFSRNFYRYYNDPMYQRACDGLYEPRNTLTILGTTVSNLRTGTAWGNGCGSGSGAGYQTRIDAYDRQNATNPPPFTPATSIQWQLVDWQQK